MFPHARHSAGFFLPSPVPEATLIVSLFNPPLRVLTSSSKLRRVPALNVRRHVPYRFRWDVLLHTRTRHQLFNSSRRRKSKEGGKGKREIGEAEGDLRVLPGPRSYSPLPNHQNVSQYSAFLDTEQRRAEEPPGKKKWSEGRRTERTSLARAIRLLCPEIPAAAPHIYNSRSIRIHKGVTTSVVK